MSIVLALVHRDYDFEDWVVELAESCFRGLCRHSAVPLKIIDYIDSNSDRSQCSCPVFVTFF